jgi:hypothetical protein
MQRAEKPDETSRSQRRGQTNTKDSGMTEDGKRRRGEEKKKGGKGEGACTEARGEEWCGSRGV